jgi:excisionase family DNA binding protein
MGKKNFTTFDVAKICGVYPTTVVDWVDAGKLKAFVTPGGHRRIRKDDLVAFLKEHNIPLTGELTGGHVPRILVVDDDDAVVQFLSELISRKFKGVESDTARDGFEVGTKLMEFSPDLMLLDIMLPGVDGFEVCKKVKSNEKTKDIKIIAMTGFDTPENRKKIQECGADDYIAKPFDNDILVSKISLFIERTARGGH